MARSKKTKHYAVRCGRKAGVYATWDQCRTQVSGYSGAVYKSFATRTEAERFVSPASAAAAAAAAPLVRKEATVRNCVAARTTGGAITGWTDGACQGNGKRNAKAGVGVYFGPDDPRNLSERLGGCRQTNQRAELTGAIRCMQRATEGAYASITTDLEIRTDSKYVMNGMHSWMPRWKRNNWLTTAKKRPTNEDLWRRLDAESHRYRSVQCVYVPAHTGVPGNEAADALATAGCALSQRNP